MKTNKNLYAVILAGGSGTRFWPLSRKNLPKQFLSLFSSKTLFQETVQRISGYIPSQNILVVTNREYEKQIHQQILDLRIPKENILLEPEGKNTAPAICWAAWCIYRKNPHALMAVLPSDHLILNEKEFIKDLTQAFKLAALNYLVTFGVVPTRPETGYGYIKTKAVRRNNNVIYKVVQFIEKPPLAQAQRYFKAKNYFWNSGMFVWSCETILQEFQKSLTEMYNLICIQKLSDIPKIWKNVQNISVDYGILEKSDRGVTVKAEGIGWSDLGSWEALAEILPKDKDGHHSRGKVIHLDSSNTLVWGDSRLIATIGLKDIVIVDTPDALLICRKDLSQKVKEMVATLKDQNTRLI